MSEEEEPIIDENQDGDGEKKVETKAPEPPKPLLRAQIQSGLSNIQKSLDESGFNFAYASLDLIGQSIATLEGDLSEFKRLRYINFMHNDLNDSDMKYLSELPKVVHLNLKRNRLESFEGLKGYNLKVLQLDNNFITKLPTNSYPSLKALCLSKNELKTLQSEQPPSLPKLEMIDVSSNALTTCQGLGEFPCLTAANLRANKINKLDGIEACTSLTLLNLGDNELPDVKELKKLAELPLLEDLDLNNNAPIYEIFNDDADVLREVLILMPNLKRFNGKYISIAEKDDAKALKAEREEAAREAAADAASSNASKEEGDEEDDEED